MTSLIARFARDETGAMAVEYGLLTALMGVGTVTAMTAVGTKLTNIFNKIGNILP